MCVCVCVLLISFVYFFAHKIEVGKLNAVNGLTHLEESPAMLSVLLILDVLSYALKTYLCL